MKNRIIDTSKISMKFRQDFINIKHTVAISAEGVLFEIGDTVGHTGSDQESQTGTISMFSIHHGTNDVIAHTENGYGRISFMYHPES